MDQPFPTRKQPIGLSASLQAFRSILHWIVRVIRVTPDEQRDAGIYLGDGRYR
jgi:hypothetical protein